MATIYFNPSCSQSRNALVLLRHCGVEPRIRLYLEDKLSAEEICALARAAGIPVRELVREKDDKDGALGLADPNRWTDERELVDLLVERPALLNRPIVVTVKGTKLCRPPELVLDLLDEPSGGWKPFAKEDGEIVIDNAGRRKL